MANNAITNLWKPVVMAGAVMSLSACMIADGRYGDGYVNGYDSNGFDCDPYTPFDDYYSCDSGYGFANIGFGGGWYDSFYYPGYGYYIFDRIGKRHKMRDHHRRYWGERRYKHGTRHARRGGRHHGEYRRGNRNLTPEQRAERRERRAERRAERRSERRGGDGTATRAPVATIRADGANRRAGNARRGNAARQARPARPRMAQQQPQRRNTAPARAAAQRPGRPAATRPPRPSRPVSRQAPRRSTRDPVRATDIE